MKMTNMKQEALKKYDVVIIGAGFSGCVAAYFLNQHYKILLIDSQPEILQKFLVTGRGFSNITNTASNENIIANVLDHPKCLYPLLHNANSARILAWCDQLKIRYHEKTPGRIHLIDTNHKFQKIIMTELSNKPNMELKLNSYANEIRHDDDCFFIKCERESFVCDHLIIATGGMSFAHTGSSGAGYGIAKDFNHQVNPLYPIGTGLEINDKYLHTLQGIALDQINVAVICNNKVLYQEIGSLMITHYGFGGPVIRRVSGYVNQCLLKKMKVEIKLTILPVNEIEKLLQNHHYLNNSFKMINHKFLLYVFDKYHLDPTWDLFNLTKLQRETIIDCLSNLTYEIKTMQPLNSAINTGGGISLNDLNMQTCMSKKVPNMYFIGEILDINPRTNGFNLTVCFSTAWACVQAINKLS